VGTETRKGIPSGRFIVTMTAATSNDLAFVDIERIATDSSFVPLTGATWGSISEITPSAPGTSQVYEQDWWPRPSSVEYWQFRARSVNHAKVRNSTSAPTSNVTVPSSAGVDLTAYDPAKIAAHLGTTSGVFGVLPNAITESLVQNFALTNISLADGAAITRVLAAGAVDTAKLADLAVASSKLADAAVSTAKMADLAVDAAKLANSAVTTTKIANAAVGSAAIANAAIGSAAIANLAVGSAAIDNAAITNAKIDRASVNKLAVVNADIVDLAAAKITAGTLVSGVIYAGTINATQVNAGTFTGLALELNLNGVTTKISNIFDGSANVGLQCKQNSSSAESNIRYDRMYFLGSTGTIALSVGSSGSSGGFLSVLDSSGTSAIEISGYGTASAAITLFGSRGITMPGPLTIGGSTAIDSSRNWQGVEIPTTKGGTGATTVSGARTNLQLIKYHGYVTSDPKSAMDSDSMAYWWDGSTLWLVYKQGSNAFRVDMTSY
jgi:hypothetical protein